MKDKELIKLRKGLFKVINNMGYVLLVFLGFVWICCLSPFMVVIWFFNDESLIYTLTVVPIAFAMFLICPEAGYFYE